MRTRVAALGPDSMGYTAWKKAPEAARRLLCTVCLHWMTDADALQASETRPLSLANCDAKRLASARRAQLGSLVGAVLSPRQFGFRRSVSILTPVVEVDTALQRVACGACSRGGGLFFDFSVSCPSMAHLFLWAVLEEAGMEPDALRAICIVYNDNRHWLAWQSEGDCALVVRSGVRRVCPMSPTLFALRTSPIIPSSRRG